MDNGWVGFDLDGTLAVYNGWEGELHIGAPIPAMVKTAKNYLAKGINVKIVTARVSQAVDNRSASDIITTVSAIELWCKEYIGQILPITCCKDFNMIALYDDRCKQVIPNTGALVEDQLNHEIENRLKLATSC